MKVTEIHYGRKIAHRSWLGTYENEEVELTIVTDEQNESLSIDDVKEARAEVHRMFIASPDPAVTSPEEQEVLDVIESAKPQEEAKSSKEPQCLNDELWTPSETYLKAFGAIKDAVSGSKLISIASHIAKVRPYKDQQEREGLYKHLFEKATSLRDQGTFAEKKFKEILAQLTHIKELDDNPF